MGRNLNTSSPTGGVRKGYWSPWRLRDFHGGGISEWVYLLLFSLVETRVRTHWRCTGFLGTVKVLITRKLSHLKCRHPWTPLYLPRCFAQEPSRWHLVKGWLSEHTKKIFYRQKMKEEPLWCEKILGKDKAGVGEGVSLLRWWLCGCVKG